MSQSELDKCRHLAKTLKGAEIVRGAIARATAVAQETIEAAEEGKMSEEQVRMRRVAPPIYLLCAMIVLHWYSCQICELQLPITHQNRMY